jgi:hypothetical protein
VNEPGDLARRERRRFDTGGKVMDPAAAVRGLFDAVSRSR